MVSRLASVCKVLFDQEVLDLRRENEKLKLELFWGRYGVIKLMAAMRASQSIWPSLKCDCIQCSAIENTVPNDEPCTFKPKYERKLAELGITFVRHSEGTRILQHECASGHADGRWVEEADAHIVLWIGGESVEDNGWADFTYGSRLFKATTTNDPELKKVEALFEWLLLNKGHEDYTDVFDGLAFQK